MLNNLFKHKSSLVIALPFVCLLILIRAFEDSLFYDPFLDYFQRDYSNLPLPQIQNVKMFAHLLLRYFLNSSLSLILIYIAFKDVDEIKFASILYIMFFIILVIAFFFIIYKSADTSKMTLFYVRRFLIQPIFILLFFPAFYYQRQKK